MSQQPPRNAMPKSGPDFGKSKTKVDAVITGKPDANANGNSPQSDSAKARNHASKQGSAPPVAPTKG
jgi:hypothetical protein